jgi:hypothetical protein
MLGIRLGRDGPEPFSDDWLWHDTFSIYAEEFPRLTISEERYLVRLWQDNGDERARQTLIEAFYGIVRP